MNKISFSQNPIGRIVGDYFTDIRLKDTNKFYTGAQLEIEYRGRSLGVAEVREVVHFYHKNINEAISILSFGRSASHVKAMLAAFYKPVDPETQFAFIVLEWKLRNTSLQEIHMKPWWDEHRHLASSSATQYSLFQ